MGRGTLARTRGARELLAARRVAAIRCKPRLVIPFASVRSSKDGFCLWVTGRLMNYQKHYDALIDRARDRVLDGYVERHHVVPRCLGGGNESSNIVALTAEEHYVAHQLLTRIYSGHSGLLRAAMYMAKRCTGNKAYGWLRRRFSNHQKIALLGNKRTLGFRPTAETRAKMSASRMGRVLNQKQKDALQKSRIGNKHFLGRKHTPETLAKMSASAMGNTRTRGFVHSLETRAKMSAATKGKKKPPRTPEHAAKMAAGIRAFWANKRALQA